MIKLGTSDMSKAYVGSTEVSKMYLGSELVYQNTPPAPLPYDAQVMYLESTGTQYIDLGIYFDSTKVYRLYVGHFTNTSTGYRVFGARSQAGTYPKSSYLTYVNTDKINFYGSNTMTSTSGTFNSPSISTIGMHTIEICCYPTKRFIVDGSSYNTPSMENAVFQSEYTLALFTENTAGTYAPKSCRFGRLEIYDPTTGVYEHDFIPVRVGQDGYIYDRITGTLKGNSGTGDFMLGNDIDVMPYDAKVEYLESDGLSFIDTGFYPNQNTRVVAELQFLTWSSWEIIFGCREAADSKEFTLQRHKSNDRIRAIYGAAKTTTQLPNVSTNKFSLDWNKRVVKVDNTPYTFASQTFTCPYTLYLYGLHSSTDEFYRARFWFCQIYDNDTLVRDYIPVRIGQTGYMYDKVSGELFGNAAESGAFILGNDI